MSTDLRIVHLTRDFPPRSNGGLSTAVGGLVAAQQRAGMECVVVSFDNFKAKSGGSVKREPERSTSPEGAQVIHVAGTQAIKRALELASNFQGHLVHVHSALLWEHAAEVARFSRCPTLLSLHTLQSEQNRLRDVKSTASGDAQAEALKVCDGIHAPSKAVANALIESTLTLGERLRVIRLAADEWPASTEASERDRFALAPTLLYVGRFADINGFGEFLKALPPLLKANPRLRAIAAGGLPSNERAEKRWHTRWKKLADNDDIRARLRFAGWVSKPELSELYAQATALVIPSWYETFGQVALEGMLHGTPIITTARGALPELVDDTCALIIEAESESAIVDGVHALLADPEAANRRRALAFDRAHDGYHWDDRIPAFREFYQQLLS